MKAHLGTLITELVHSFKEDLLIVCCDPHGAGYWEYSRAIALIHFKAM